MFYKWSYVLILCSAFLFTNCTNELDVTTSYKDTTIVYGLLSPGDSIQYIKIYKAFLGDGNALQFAQQADSFYFPDVLKVQLIKIKQGIIIDTITMKRDTLSPMTDGMFAYTPNVIYSTTEPIEIKCQYQLNIHNNKTGSMITANTAIPDDADLYEPSPVSDIISLASGPQYNINWQSGLYAKVYTGVMRFYYDEITSGVSVPKYVDWQLGTKFIKDASETENLNLLKPKDGFYINLEKKLAVPDSQTYRLAGKIEIMLYGAAEDYYYYQHINNVTVGVNQSIPSYTNIQNGLGIFSAKTISRWSFDLDGASYYYLRHGPYTNKLKFY